MFGDPFDDPFFASPFGQRGMPSPFDNGNAFSSMSMSTSSGMTGGSNMRSKSVSRTTRIINGRPQTVTITNIRDEQGLRTIEDYGNGQQRVLVNGVEQHASVEGSQPPQGYLPAPPNGHEEPPHYNSQYAMPNQPYAQGYYQHQPTYWDHW
jgi:hypothetical protein